MAITEGDGSNESHAYAQGHKTFDQLGSEISVAAEEVRPVVAEQAGAIQASHGVHMFRKQGDDDVRRKTFESCGSDRCEHRGFFAASEEDAFTRIYCVHQGREHAGGCLREIILGSQHRAKIAQCFERLEEATEIVFHHCQRVVVRIGAHPTTR
jgi:hypothetical protein